METRTQIEITENAELDAETLALITASAGGWAPWLRCQEGEKGTPQIGSSQLEKAREITDPKR